MTAHFSAGDIIQGAKRGKTESFHPIIYFGEIDPIFFEGGMITHSNKYGNVKLKDEHFAQKIDSDFRPSYFVRNFLIKKKEWGSFIKIGELSDQGMTFLRNHLDGTSPMVWESYNT